MLSKCNYYDSVYVESCLEPLQFEGFLSTIADQSMRVTPLLVSNTSRVSLPILVNLPLNSLDILGFIAKVPCPHHSQGPYGFKPLLCSELRDAIDSDQGLLESCLFLMGNGAL